MSVLKEQFVAIKEGRLKDFGIVAFTGSGGMGKTKLLKSAKSVAAEMDFRLGLYMPTCWSWYKYLCTTVPTYMDIQIHVTNLPTYMHPNLPCIHTCI